MIAIVILIGSVFAVAQGLTYPLLAFILERQGVPAILIGLNGAMLPLGIVCSAPLLPLVTKYLGAAWMAISAALLLAAMLGVIGVWHDLAVWFPARFLMGVAVNGLFVSSEMWVNVLAPPTRRGRIMGIFASVLSAGFALGPLLIVVTGTRGAAPFVVGIAIFALTALILFVARRGLPELHAEGDTTIRTFLPLAPLLLLAVAITAAFDQGVLSLLPAYGKDFGVGEATMATALSILITGNILFQVPIGWLADRWSRHATSMLLCALTVAGAALLPLVIGTTTSTLALFFVWGSTAWGVYTLALIELGDRFKGALLLSGNAAFSLMWGIGGVIGPPVYGAAMTWLGPHGLPLMLGATYFILLVAGTMRSKLPVPSSASD